MAKSEVVVVMRSEDYQKLYTGAVDLFTKTGSTIYKHIEDGGLCKQCRRKGYKYLRWYNVNWNEEESKFVRYVMNFLRGLDCYDFIRIDNDGIGTEVVEKANLGLISIERRINLK